MDDSPSEECTVTAVTGSTSMTDLPEEILEFIFMKVSPYKDLKSASLVCWRWHAIVQDVLRKLQYQFRHSVLTGNLTWSTICPDSGCRITERYSHSACYYDKCLYVFGGCTATNTTLNDLWRFDLASREWIRPLAMGTYPFPKACATLVVYKDNLVLFGGWSHPTPFPLHQAARFFSELHMYKPSLNRWSHVATLSHQSPQAVAGHSASVVRDMMVVFGGSQVPGVRTNEVWVFDFIEGAWRQPRTSTRKPTARYGQTQVTLDDSHILIVGGKGGCSNPLLVYKDCWLLTLGQDEWTWEPIDVRNADWSPAQLWCHAACRVSDTIVTLCKPSKRPEPSPQQSPRTYKKASKLWIPPKEELSNDGNAHHFLPTNQHPVAGVSTNQEIAGTSYDGGCGTRESEVKVTVQEDQQHVSIQEDQQPVSIQEDQQHVDSVSSHNLPPANDPQQPGASGSSHDVLSANRYIASRGTSNISLESTDSSDSSDAGEDGQARTMNPRPGQPSIRPNAMRNRQKQLEALLKYEKRFRHSENSTPVSVSDSVSNQNRASMSSSVCSKTSSTAANIQYKSPKSVKPNSLMVLHVLDISTVLECKAVTWQKINYDHMIGAPEETIFYSLLEGRGELLMFGGIEKDIHSLKMDYGYKAHIVNNSLHVLSPVQYLL